MIWLCSTISNANMLICRFWTDSHMVNGSESQAAHFVHKNLSFNKLLTASPPKHKQKTSRLPTRSWGHHPSTRPPTPQPKGKFNSSYKCHSTWTFPKGGLLGYIPPTASVTKRARAQKMERWAAGLFGIFVFEQEMASVGQGRGKGSHRLYKSLQAITVNQAGTAENSPGCRQPPKYTT